MWARDVQIIESCIPDGEPEQTAWLGIIKKVFPNNQN